MYDMWLLRDSNTTFLLLGQEQADGSAVACWTQTIKLVQILQDYQAVFSETMAIIHLNFYACGCYHENFVNQIVPRSI